MEFFVVKGIKTRRLNEDILEEARNQIQVKKKKKQDLFSVFFCWMGINLRTDNDNNDDDNDGINNYHVYDFSSSSSP